MAKFSISEDDEEAPLIYRRRQFTGPASQSLISVQRPRSWVVTEEDDELIPIKDVEFDSHSYEEEEDDEFEAAGEDSRNEHRGGGRGEAEGDNQQQQMASSPVSGTAASPVFNNASEAILQAMLTKSDVLDCPICLDPLFSPVFQCENGDAMCSSCCSKVQSKCPFCCMSIGNNRCRGIEMFIESICSISCKYTQSGCKKTMPYSKKSEHERMCPYASCYCPYPSCHFAGPSKKLYLHFGIEHAASSSTTCFTYNTTFSISIETNQKCLFLQEQNERVIFILNHQVHEHGQRVFTVDFVGGLGTLLESCFEYQLTAKSKETSFSMQSVPEIYAEWSDSTPRKYYLALPSGFVDYNTGLLSLSVCIKKGISSKFEAEVEAEEVGNEDDDGSDYGHANGALQVVLTNPYVFHCSLCLEPLWTPVFQCEKGGHLTCSSCCSKMKNKCRSCYQIPVDNGYKYNRCRGLESIIESVRILCKNARYGCKKTMYYHVHVKGDHEVRCPFDLCFCPYPSCPYTGCSTNLYHHFSIQHAASTTRFTYKTTFPLCVDINQKHMFLQEVHDGAIFIVNHQVQEHGRAFYVDRIGPASNNRSFMYQLTAKTTEEASASATLKSVPETHTNWSQHPPTNNYLTIPPDFVGYKGLLSLSICITKCI